MQKAHAETLHTFEYLLLLSALAVLGRGRAQPPQSTAVSALIAQERPDKDKGKKVAVTTITAIASILILMI